MKFTEEQYQKIVEMFEKVNDEYNMGFLNPNIVTFFQDKLYKEFGDVMYFVEDWQSITAFANPLTREWAHDKFVEEEKKYYWKRNGLYLIKDKFDGSIIFDSYKKLFTESEIIFWGYNPDMFDREEE